MTYILDNLLFEDMRTDLSFTPSEKPYEEKIIYEQQIRDIKEEIKKPSMQPYTPDTPGNSEYSEYSRTESPTGQTGPYHEYPSQIRTREDNIGQNTPQTPGSSSTEQNDEIYEEDSNEFSNLTLNGQADFGDIDWNKIKNYLQIAFTPNDLNIVRQFVQIMKVCGFTPLYGNPQLGFIKNRKIEDNQYCQIGYSLLRKNGFIPFAGVQHAWIYLGSQ